MRAGDVDLGVGVLGVTRHRPQVGAEQKLPSAPVRMIERMSSSAHASTMASYIRTSIAPVSALKRFGRFM